MLTLRLARGAHPAGHSARLLVTCASAGAGFLLLAALARALAHPGSPGASARLLLWCLVPLAAAVQLAVTVARTTPGARSRPGLDAAGLGSATGLPVLAAVSAAVSCTLGSLIALLVFLHLRGQLADMPFGGSAVRLLAAGHPLPFAGTLTLLCAAPLSATAVTALATRSRTRTRRQADSVVASPALPWGVALAAGGLSLETLTGHPLTGGAGADHLPAGVVVGCLAAAAGLVLAGPAVVHLCGWLVAAHQPGAARLLAGRGLQQQARTAGGPWGVLCAVAAGALTAAALPDGVAGPGGGTAPLVVPGAALVVCCTLASAVTAAAVSRREQAPSREVLTRAGAPRQLRWKAAALRAGTLLATMALVAWGMATLALLPLT